jgi:hypothetical protein
MKSIVFLILISCTQIVSADENTRQKLSETLISGSPWSFSNKHVSETQHWRLTADGILETMSSYVPDVWIPEAFTKDDTIIHPSRAGGNTITYSLDKDGNVSAVHSKNQSIFKSMRLK